MARTDDDSWDITESVGATALGVALARAVETASEHPLFTDPYAQLFVDAAVARGWTSPMGDEVLLRADPRLAQRMAALCAYAAARTKWFDEFFVAAGAAGIHQAVILAAGLDARVWRLPWATDTVVYEIDQPMVLQFKADTLRANDAQPAAGYVAVPVDLRQDWPKALREAGFDRTRPTAWSAEGLLPYLPADAQDRLFERIQRLSVTGSRIAVESFGAGFFAPERQQRRRVLMQQLRDAAAKAGHHLPDPEDLWFPGDRTDVAGWLGDHGWELTVTPADRLMARYHREPPIGLDDAAPPSDFVEGRLSGQHLPAS